MSGTSLDGIDVAICMIEGTGNTLRQHLIGFSDQPFDTALRSRLLAASSGELALRETFELQAQLGSQYADAITQAIASSGLSRVDAVGLHGQTVYHAPNFVPAGISVQLSGAATVAARTRAIVVDDFRSADIAVGGQGAPLVPYCDLALLHDSSRNRIALNLGGIANLTWLPRDAGSANLVAFDTGPANMLVDTAMRLLFDRNYDESGEVASSGTVDHAWLEELVASEPYFHRSPPKSTGRELFGEEKGRLLVSSAVARGIISADVIATLTALTARTVADASRMVSSGVTIDDVIVGGGGARNATMMRMIADELRGTRVVASDELGIPSDAKEAICFAILANEAICETPANVPSVTGARSHAVCGAIHLPPRD